MVSVIIVNYNTRELVLNCIRSIRDKCSDCEIIVVDNASTDGSAESLSEQKDIIFIKSEKNLGFSKANNLGYAKSRGEYIVFLNPDTIVNSDLTGGFVSIYNSNFAGERVILSPKIVNPDGSPQHSLNLFPEINLRSVVAHYKKKSSIKKDKRFIYTDWITGVCYFIARGDLEEIGGWNEEFFLYGEDLELCYRFKKHGAKICRVRDIVLTHYGNQSGKQVYTSKQSYFAKTNALKKFFDIYYGEKKFFRYMKRSNMLHKSEYYDEYIASLKDNK